jgi:hypothetical protein
VNIKSEVYQLQSLLLKLAFTIHRSPAQAAKFLGLPKTTLLERKKALIRLGFDPMPDRMEPEEICVAIKDHHVKCKQYVEKIKTNDKPDPRIPEHEAEFVQLYSNFPSGVGEPFDF